MMYRCIAWLFVAIVSSTPAHALYVYEWTLDMNTGSKHSQATYGDNQFYNEDNDGIGITYGYSDSIDVKVGYFRNSYDKNSVYAGVVFNKDYYWYNDIVVSPGIAFLLMTGYENAPENLRGLPVVPAALPSISIGHRTLRSTIGYMPYGRHKVFTFQTQIQF